MRTGKIVPKLCKLLCASVTSVSMDLCLVHAPVLAFCCEFI